MVTKGEHGVQLAAGDPPTPPTPNSRLDCQQAAPSSPPSRLPKKAVLRAARGHDFVSIRDAVTEGISVRGEDRRTGALFSYVDLESRARPDPPLRVIREAVNAALAATPLDFETLYSRLLRPGIARAAKSAVRARVEHGLAWRSRSGLTRCGPTGPAPPLPFQRVGLPRPPAEEKSIKKCGAEC